MVDGVAAEMTLVEVVVMVVKAGALGTPGRELATLFFIVIPAR